MKRTVSDLAVLGGTPAFAEPLHVGRPHIGDHAAVLARVEEMIESRWLTNNGPFVEELELRIAEHLGVGHCVATSSGTSALQIAALAAGMSGEVIVPAFSFVATAHALRWVGIDPVLCDIDPRTHNLDPAAVEPLVSGRTTGVIPVHLWGRAADVEALESVCARHGLVLAFDAAHAFGCSHAGRMIGGFGSAEVLSLHATKVLNAVEGGAVVTDDPELAERARLMRNFGFSDYDQVVALGTNAKMSELSAAVGLTSLDHLDEFVERNRRNRECYADRLAGVSGVSMLELPHGERNNHHHVVLEVAGVIERDVLHRTLWAENVLARRYFYPGIHRMQPYASTLARSFPHTDAVAARTLLLPSGGDLEEDSVTRVCELVRFACENADALGARLETSAS